MRVWACVFNVVAAACSFTSALLLCERASGAAKDQSTSRFCFCCMANCACSLPLGGLMCDYNF